MGATFTESTEWMLEHLTPEQEDGGKRPAGTAYPAQNYTTWQRTRTSIALFRHGAGLVSYASSVGDEQLSVAWTGGGDSIELNISVTCVENPLLPGDGPGLWIERIVWENKGAWLEVLLPGGE